MLVALFPRNRTSFHLPGNFLIGIEGGTACKQGRIHGLLVAALTLAQVLLVSIYSKESNPQLLNTHLIGSSVYS